MLASADFLGLRLDLQSQFGLIELYVVALEQTQIVIQTVCQQRFNMAFV